MKENIENIISTYFGLIGKFIKTGQSIGESANPITAKIAFLLNSNAHDYLLDKNIEVKKDGILIKTPLIEKIKDSMKELGSIGTEIKSLIETIQNETTKLEEQL